MTLLKVYQYRDIKLYKFIHRPTKNNQEGYILYREGKLIKAETNVITKNFTKVKVNNYDFT